MKNWLFMIYSPILNLVAPSVLAMPQWQPLNPEPAGILPEVTAGEGGVCSFTPGRLQPMAMGLVSSVSAFKWAQSQGGLCWATKLRGSELGGRGSHHLHVCSQPNSPLIMEWNGVRAECIRPVWQDQQQCTDMHCILNPFPGPIH